MSLRTTLSLAAGLVLTASASWAQTRTPAPAPKAGGGPEGFAIESPNGDFRLQIGALIQADGRFAIEDEGGQYMDTFSVRRLRPYLRGRFSSRFEFYLNPDFAGGALVVQDAYVDTIFGSALRLRAGKAKTPFGMERLQSASNLMFIERALPTALVPNRDVGVQVLGEFSGGIVGYFAGVANGVSDGGSADADTNDGKDVSARVVLRPFRRQSGSVLQGLGAGLSGASGDAGALPTIRTAILLQPFFSYATGPAGAVADGRRTRYSPQLWYFHRSFGGWVEYVHSQTPVRSGTDREDVSHRAWQVAASWMLTGEDATDASSGVRPRANFDFGNGHWGALQLAARYHAFRADDSAFAQEVAAAASSHKAEAWTLGLRWFLTGNFAYTLNFERTVFDDDADGSRQAENALAFRTQVNF